MSIRELWKNWENFWLRSESPIGMSIFRILFGSIVLQWCLLTYPDLLNWFGMHGICSLQSSQQVLAVFGPPGVNVLNWMPVGNSSIYIVFWFTAIAALFLTIGLFTRMSAVFVFLGVASFQQQNCLIVNGGEILLKMTAFYLIFSSAGHYLSLDWLLKKKRQPLGNPPVQSESSGWPQRLFRFLIALIYFQAFWSKLDDPTWLNGSAMYYVLREQEFLRFPVAWISSNLWMCKTLTWGSLLIEGAMWSLVWFKETRYYVLAGVVLLHLGIEYAMNLPIFESLMIASLVVFVPTEDLKFAYNKLRTVFSRSGSVPSAVPSVSNIAA